MRTLVPSGFLKGVLLIDAGVSSVLGVAMLAFAPELDVLLALPATLLRSAGVVTVAYVAYLLWLASRARAPAFALWAPVVLNVVWAADCALIAFGVGGFAPNGLGQGFLAVQAAGTLLLADLQYVGLKRSRPIGAAAAA